jgi:hypothetical protein
MVAETVGKGNGGRGWAAVGSEWRFSKWHLRMRTGNCVNYRVGACYGDLSPIINTMIECPETRRTANSPHSSRG